MGIGRLSSKIKAKVIEIDDEYQVDENYGVSEKVVGATKATSEQIRSLDEKYGIADKLVGAALAIGSIQLASGKFKGGATTLAGATIFAAMTERRKEKKQADEHELH